MPATELYQAGNLTEAVEAALQEVKREPANTDKRGWLAVLLCFAGEFERADKQLETLAGQAPENLVGVSMLRQLIRGEIARQQFHHEGRLPEFVGEVAPHLRLHLDASIALREGAQTEAFRLLAEADRLRPEVRGECDGQPFVGLRDLDDLTSSFFEVLTSTGKYYWIPFEIVELVEFHPPERPQDLLWRRARMVVTNGPDGEIYLPAIYNGTRASGDDQLRLGRGTDWQTTDEGPTRGEGQRMYLIGDADQSILALHEISISQ